MATNRKDRMRSARRATRVKTRIKSDSGLLRVSVFRSLKNMYAQIIDDAQKKTIVSCSSLQIDVAGDKTAVARGIGVELAKRAQKEGITAVVFDRGKCRYHGRVKALAEGLREGGLTL